jgi:hypothetical protein
MAEGEGVGAGGEVGGHRSEEVPSVLIRSMLRVLIDAEDIPIDLEDDVLMILMFIAIRMSGTAQIRVALHHPAREDDVTIHREREWVGVGFGFDIPADIVIIGAEEFEAGRTGREIGGINPSNGR